MAPPERYTGRRAYAGSASVLGLVVAGKTGSSSIEKEIVTGRCASSMSFFTWRWRGVRHAGGHTGRGCEARRVGTVGTTSERLCVIKIKCHVLA